MLLNSDKRKFLRILVKLKQINAGTFTHKELSTYLTTSKRKINSFMRGKIYDIDLLIRFSRLLGMDIKLKLCL